MNIRPNSDISNNEVKLLRNPELQTTYTQTAHLNQQRTDHKQSQENRKQNIEIPVGIDLEESNINDKQKEQLKHFLPRWKDTFSTSVTDLGNCNLVKHEIKLIDNEPIKEPARRIPPALFQIVKEHLQEMMEAGAIRPSHSPYSTNVVIVRKKDGSFRFCVDFRKLNNKTIKDAYGIPRIEDSLHLLAGSKYFSK